MVEREAALLVAVEAGERHALSKRADSPTADWRLRAMIRKLMPAAVPRCWPARRHLRGIRS